MERDVKVEKGKLIKAEYINQQNQARIKDDGEER